MTARLTARELLFLFALGATGGLVGDAAAVSAGTTRYLDHSVPFVWESPIWFPILVGLGTAALGDLRLRLGPPRPGFDLRTGIGAFAAVIAIYALTSTLGDDGLASTTLVLALGVLAVSLLADGRPAVICALAAAMVGPLVEIAIVELDLSEYSDPNDALFGVGFWLPGLYLAFGVTVARLAELLVAARR